MTISNDIQSNPLLQGLSINNRTVDESSDELGQDAFLRLMIAQLNNQDPLSPRDNGEFIAQLAQFSSVEGITNLNNSFEQLETTLQSSFRSSQALEASSLVGRSIQIDTNQADYEKNQNMVLQGVIDLPADATELTVSVKNAAGELVRQVDMGKQGLGMFSFVWDGSTGETEEVDGEEVPVFVESGGYTFEATATINGNNVEMPVKMAANVNSVSIGADNAVTLNVQGVGPVTLDSVSRFL